MRLLRAALAETNQDPSTFHIAKRVYIVIGDDSMRAHERVEDGSKRIYGVSGLADIDVYGPPSACITGLREVAEAGAELIQLHLLFDDTEQMEDWPQKSTVQCKTSESALLEPYPSRDVRVDRGISCLNMRAL